MLSPEICCERKSIPDLRQSLASGRLYHQVGCNRGVRGWGWGGVGAGWCRAVAWGGWLARMLEAAVQEMFVLKYDAVCTVHCPRVAQLRAVLWCAGWRS